jgi:retron-type reverse transcriptase
LSGSNLNNGTNAGAVASNANDAVTDASQNVSAPLNFFLDIKGRPCRSAKNYLFERVLVGGLPLENAPKRKADTHADTQTHRRMKRYGFLYRKLCSYEHLFAAAERAKRGKNRQKSVAVFYKNLEANLLELQRELVSHTYATSPYYTFVIHEPKERVIYRLPFRDRVVQWAIMLVLEPIWVKSFTRDTYSCITGRGIHGLFRKLAADLKAAPEETAYSLKLDIRKFYPSIDHDILKRILREKIKDVELLRLLDGVIDSVQEDKGVPIGNYLSQFLANLYLSEFDHLLKEQYRVKYYYRYADDIVILSGSKAELHGLLVVINQYLHSERNMALKGNYQVFPVASRGIDFVGYVFYNTHVLARKKNKKALARELYQLRRRGLPEKLVMLKTASRVGFIRHANSTHLFRTLNVVAMKKFSEVAPQRGRLDGNKLPIDSIINRNIRLLGFSVGKSKHNNDDCLTLQFEIEEKTGTLNAAGDKTGEVKSWVKHIAFTGSKNLVAQLKEIPVEDFPFEAQIIKQPIGDGNKFFYKFTDPD